MRLQWRSLHKAPSNVSIGLAYELLVLKVLQSYSFRIRHTGRKGDRGQDFIGHWVLPDQRVPVVGQCKHHTKPLSPGDVREFENVLQRKGAHHLTCAGLLVSHSGFSTKAVETFQSSKVAMMLCQIKAKPVSSILSWNSNGNHGSNNHGNSNPGNNTCGSNSDHADSKSYCLEMEAEDSTPHNRMQPTTSEHSHAHNSGIIREFALNSKAQKLLTNVQVTLRHNSLTSSFEGRGEVVLFCSIHGKLHNIQKVMEKERTLSV